MKTTIFTNLVLIFLLLWVLILTVDNNNMIRYIGDNTFITADRHSGENLKMPLTHTGVDLNE